MSGVMRVLIGGVGYRWMGDSSFGVVASDVLARQQWPAGVEVADLGYGALYAALDLVDARPRYDRLILLAAACRNRLPGRLYSYRWAPSPSDDADLQERIREAGAGVIGIDHLLQIARHFAALPDDVLCIELEPHVTSDVSRTSLEPGAVSGLSRISYPTGDTLTASAAACLHDALRLVRTEVLIPAVAHHEGRTC